MYLYLKENYIYIILFISILLLLVLFNLNSNKYDKKKQTVQSSEQKIIIIPCFYKYSYLLTKKEKIHKSKYP